MKKKWLALLALLSCACMAVGFSGCKGCGDKDDKGKDSSSVSVEDSVDGSGTSGSGSADVGNSSGNSVESYTSADSSVAGSAVGESTSADSSVAGSAVGESTGADSSVAGSAGEESTSANSADSSNSSVAVTGIALDKGTLTITAGSTAPLVVSVLPENATNKGVVWISSNESVATVDGGIVTAKKEGNAIISVVSLDGEKVAYCMVTVNPNPNAVSYVSLDKYYLTLSAGQSAELTATVYPSTATNKKVTWSSSNTDVATVVNGTVIGVAKGTATITVTTEEGGETDTCSVTVTPATWIEAEGFTRTGDTYKKTVSNATATEAFGTELAVSQAASYQIFTDEKCETALTETTVSLAAGNNTYYVKVTCGGDSKVYTFIVRRKPLYTVTFDSLGGGSVPDQIVEEGGLASKPTVALSKTGYTFKGWEDWDFAKRTVLEDTKLTATWEANTYVLYFDANGGLENPESQFVDYDSEYGWLPSADRTGYTLDGWFTEATGGEKIERDDLVKVAADQTLYAHWTARKYTVWFQSDYETLTEGTVTYDDVYGNIVNEEGYTWQDAEAFSKRGYTLEGWYQNVDTVLEKEITGETKVTTANDHTLVAKWSANTYTLSFDTQGGSEIADKTVTYDTEYGTLPTPTKAGYHFEGWFPTADFEENSKIETYTYIYTADDHTLYAKWALDVNYEKQGDAYVVTGQNGDASKIVILDTYESLPVTGVANEAFSYNGYIHEVVLGANVKTVGMQAFYDCGNLRSITATDALKTVGDEAFYGCENLATVSGGRKVETIGTKAFSRCNKLTEVSLPDTVTSLGISAFASCDTLQTVILGTGITEISERAFYDCAMLQSVTINGNVITIEKEAFYRALRLKTITLPATVETIGYEAFFESGLTSIILSENLTTIENGAFRGSSLQTVVIPDKVTVMGDRAFYGCEKLTSIRLGAKLGAIGEYTFYNCKRLNSVVVAASTLVGGVDYYAFGNCSALNRVYLYIDEDYNGGDMNNIKGSYNESFKNASKYVYSATQPTEAVPEGAVGYWYYGEDNAPKVW